MVRTPMTDAAYQNDEVKQRREAMVPLGRIGQAEDIARAVSYLAGPGASYATGINLRLDGGVCDAVLTTILSPPKTI
jgi:NAD(P)-dependent dehydrogenase (short-subunit alcohol dehydrogenase family)